MTHAILNVDGVSASHPAPHRRALGAEAVQVLDAITFSLYPGEYVGLVGESGSGKSTLARVLAGLHPADAGVITLGDVDLDTLRPADRRAFLSSTVRLVFQHPDAALNTGRTVGSILRQALRLHSALPAAAHADRIATLLHRAGLPQEVARAYPNQLSGGEKRRVGLCRALATEPTLLIADELTSGLDPLLRRQMLALLDAELAPRRGSALLISHDLASVFAVCTRIGVLHAGRLVDLAAPVALQAPSAHPQTRRLVQAHQQLSLGGA